ncbi:MAG TPA: hypothetical protein VEW03_01570, partial [Longimicrobiaceae bacterium]|nr:hypothetical protein [Longimicrobiaceae bacterium]
MTTPVPTPAVPHRVVAVVIVFFGAGLAGALPLLLLPGVVALVAPSTATMASLGAMALGHVALRLVNGSLPWLSTPNIVSLGLLAVLGAAALRLSFTAPEPNPRRPWLPLLPLLVVALLQLLGLVMVGDLDVRGVDPALGGLGLLLVGLGAGLMRLRPAPLRWTGAASLAAALAVLVLSLGSERLRGAEPRIAWSRGTPAAGLSVPIDGSATLDAVSPSARYFTLREFQPGPPGSRDGAWSYSVADFAGFRRPVAGVEVAFLSDEQLVVLAARGAALEVRSEPVQGGAAVWTRPLPPMLRPELFVDGSGRWSVVGTRPDSGGMIMATAAGSGPVRSLSAPAAGAATFAVPLGEGMLLFDRQPRASGHRWVSLLGAQIPLRWVVRLAGTGGELRLGTVRGFPRCSGSDASEVVCEEHMGGVNRGMLWSFDGSGRMQRVGFVPLDLFERTLRGGVFGAVRSGNEALLVDTRTRRGARLGFSYARAAHPVAGGAVVQHH